jgi:hypothetical protein
MQITRSSRDHLQIHFPAHTVRNATVGGIRDARRQPALITLISATIAKAASGRSVLLMVAPWCVEIG